jgi:hypothetical protein
MSEIQQDEMKRETDKRRERMDGTSRREVAAEGKQ